MPPTESEIAELLYRLGNQYAHEQIGNPARVEVGSFMGGNGTGNYIILLTPRQIMELPDGVELTNFFDGTVKITGREYIDLDTRAGFTCWGIPEEEFC